MKARACISSSSRCAPCRLRVSIKAAVYYDTNTSTSKSITAVRTRTTPSRKHKHKLTHNASEYAKLSGGKDTTTQAMGTKRTKGFVLVLLVLMLMSSEKALDMSVQFARAQ